MKRKMLLLLFILPMYLFGQNEHLEFKGIPIDGFIDSFIAKMEKEGFKKVSQTSGGVIMTGNFVNKSCTVIVVSTPKTKSVWKVSVFLPEDASWYSLKSDYNYFKEQFNTKYGEPSNSFEFFSKPYYEGDGYELQALGKDKCTYATYWELEKGYVVVKIGTDGQIVFGYEDKINSNKSDGEKESNIQNDI